MKTILTLKLTMSMFILISLMSFTTVASITPSDDYKSFQKNVEPKNAVFVQLNILDYSDKEQKTGDFYTIYKQDNEGHGYYFKILLDDNNLPIASFVAEGDKSISDHTKQHLYWITSNLLNLNIDSKYTVLKEDSTAECVIKCNRKNGCYNEPTNSGVLLCTADCHLSCS